MQFYTTFMLGFEPEVLTPMWVAGIDQSVREEVLQHEALCLGSSVG